MPMLIKTLAGTSINGVAVLNSKLSSANEPFK